MSNNYLKTCYEAIEAEEMVRIISGVEFHANLWHVLAVSIYIVSVCCCF